MTPFHQAKAQAVEAFERSYFLEALAMAGGNVSAAAKLIGVNRTWLFERPAKYGLRSGMPRRVPQSCYLG